jgi:hypothetical protein
MKRSRKGGRDGLGFLTKAVIVLALAVVASLAAAETSMAGPPIVLGPNGQLESSASAPLASIPYDPYQCGAGYQYAGFIRNESISTTASIHLWMESDSIVRTNPSHLLAYVDVDNASTSNLEWIQAGLWLQNNSNGLQKYIEWNTGSGAVQAWKGAASYGTGYSATITKVSAGVWTASVGGSSLGKNEDISGMQETEYMGESYLNAMGSCNYMDETFASSSPYSTGQMTDVGAYPYYTSSVTSNGWVSSG